MLREPLKDRARGRWHGILTAVGVSAKALRNKHGPCPICGGKDRFRFDDKDGYGTWICSQCGAGDGIELVKRLLRLEFKDAAREIEKHIDTAIVVSSGSQKSDGQIRDELSALWARTKPIDELDAAGLYLARRSGITIYPPILRFAPDERYVHQGARAEWHPAMVAKIEPSDEAAALGETAALHRTYLDGYGGKANVPSARKAMGTMPTGAAIRLMPHDEVLGVAEGIETAFAASALFNVPVWSTINAGLMETWVPPASVTTVWVFGDNDPKFAGQCAAYTLAKRLAHDQRLPRNVYVEIPPTVGEDWDDVRQRQRGGVHG